MIPWVACLYRYCKHSHLFSFHAKQGTTVAVSWNKSAIWSRVTSIDKPTEA